MWFHLLNLFLHFLSIKSATIVFVPFLIDTDSSALQKSGELSCHIVFDHDDFVSFFLEFFDSLSFEWPDVGVLEIVYVRRVLSFEF